MAPRSRTDTDEVQHVLRSVGDAPHLQHYERLVVHNIARRLLKWFPEDTTVRILRSGIMRWALDRNPYDFMTVAVFFELFDSLVPPQRRRTQILRDLDRLMR